MTWSQDKGHVDCGRDVKDDATLKSTLFLLCRCGGLSGDTQSHLGPLALFCNHIMLGSISICDFSVVTSCLEAFPSATFSIVMSCLEVFPSMTFVTLGSVSICDLFLYYLLVVSRLNGLTHLFIVPLYLFTSVNSIL